MEENFILKKFESRWCTREQFRIFQSKSSYIFNDEAYWRSWFLLQNQCPAVAESAVIGFSHSIKGQGEQAVNEWTCQLILSNKVKSFLWLCYVRGVCFCGAQKGHRCPRGGPVLTATRHGIQKDRQVCLPGPHPGNYVALIPSCKRMPNTEFAVQTFIPWFLWFSHPLSSSSVFLRHAQAR